MTDTIEVPRELLAQIISDLPSRRDWLDPVLEQRARDVLAQPASVPDEVRDLRNLCAELYQVLGVLDAPANVLDAASVAANGEPVPAGSLLPFSGEQYEFLRRDAERSKYWKQRAKSAEGHLWCADHLVAAKALHPRTALSAIAWDDLSPAQIAQLSSAVTVVIGAVNACRDARRPADTAMATKEVKK